MDKPDLDGCALMAGCAEQLSRGGNLVTVVVTGPGGMFEFCSRLDGQSVDEAPSGSAAHSSALCREINEHVKAIRDAAKALALISERAVDSLAENMAVRHGKKPPAGKTS